MTKIPVTTTTQKDKVQSMEVSGNRNPGGMTSTRTSHNNVMSKRKESTLKTKFRLKRRVLMCMWTVWFVYMSLTAPEVESVPALASSSQNNFGQEDREPYASLNWRTAQKFASRKSLVEEDNNRFDPIYRPLLKATLNEDDYDSDYDLVAGFNCTPPAILDFPSDLFNQAQRRGGAIVAHFIASLYVFYALAIVCDDYFVPAIELICEELKMPPDVAGATFMAIGTSAPEFFTNIIGTFVTEGDIGVGTIVGSAVFNILAVCACCGFAAKMALPLDWYPLTRDCIFYLLSVILLLVVLQDEKVHVYESAILILVYGLYIIAMWKNTALKKGANSLVERLGFNVKEKYSPNDDPTQDSKPQTESTPLLGGGDPPRKFSGEENEFVSREDYDDMLIHKALQRQKEDAEEEEGEYGLCEPPRGESCGVWLEWIVGWPARLVFTLTVPDCRKSSWRRFYPLTFIMCIVYIAVLAYIVSWLMTVIGHTFSIPDSVTGLTFVAAGTSVPEAVSSIIVARQGLGSMSISNSIGSNTFDILMCLGIPWLIKGLMVVSSEINYIQINSTGLEYSIIMLLVSLVFLYILLACNQFYLDKKVGLMALVMYAVFLVFASLFELNFFFQVNLPACDVPDNF